MAVLQSVLLARVTWWGVYPDLLLVSVIILTVFEKDLAAISFAGLAGFTQDLLSIGVYLNTLVKITVAAVIVLVKESFVGREKSLVLWLVLVLSPVCVAIEALALTIILGQTMSLAFFCLNLFIKTGLNLALAPLLTKLIRSFTSE